MTAATNKPDLTALSLPELRELAAEVGTLIAEKEKTARSDLAAEIEQLAKERGFAVADILPLFPNLPPVHAPTTPKGKASKGGRGTVAPKYRNPADPSQAWSGRGRQPAWVAAHLASGGALESITIQAA